MSVFPTLSVCVCVCALDIGNDGLEVCFKILEAYTVLCASQPAQFMQVWVWVLVKMTWDGSG